MVGDIIKQVLVTGGKTGGHIYPLLKICDSLDNVVYYGMPNSLEEKLCQQKRINFKKVNIKDKGKLKKLFSIFKEAMRIKRDLNKNSIIIASGGFVSFPLLLAGLLKNIPYYLIEENAVLGATNRFFKWKAKKLFLTFPLEEEKIKKAMVVGNPCTDVIYNKYQYPMPKGKKMILFIGGSKGSKIIGKLAIQCAKIISDDYQIILVAGSFYPEFKAYEQKKLIVYEYINNLYNMMINVHLIISRGGSSTISEAVNSNKPLIVIPSRSVKKDHQYKNALYLMKNNGCIIFDENDNARSLMRIIDKTLNDLAFKNLMKIAQMRLMHKDVVKTILKEIEGELLLNS